jgi:hypothetical protein
MLPGELHEITIANTLESMEASAPPLDELGRDPLAFVAHWVEYASTSSVGQTWIALLALGLSCAALAGQFFHGRKAQLSAMFAKTPDYRGRERQECEAHPT